MKINKAIKETAKDYKFYGITKQQCEKIARDAILVYIDLLQIDTLSKIGANSKKKKMESLTERQN